MHTAKILPPTAEEIKIAGRELYDELVKTEKQPIDTMRSAKEVLAEARARLKANASV